MSTAKPRKPILGTAWTFHPMQQLDVQLEPWQAQALGLSVNPRNYVILRGVTVLRVFTRAVVLKGKSGKELTFQRNGISVIECLKEGIVHAEPKPADVRLNAALKDHPHGRVYVNDGEIIVQFPYIKETHEATLAIVKKIPGDRFYNRTDKTWRWEANAINALNIIKGLSETRIDTSDATLTELSSHAEEELREIRARIEAAQAVKLVDPKTLTQPEGLKTQLWPHQLQALHYAIQFRGSGLFLGMGAGKTLTTIAIAVALGVMKILVICPKQVLPVWQMEFEQHCARPVHVVCLDAEIGAMRKRVEHAKREMAYAEQQGIPCVIVVTAASAIRPPFGPKFSVDEKGRETGQIAAANRGWALSRGEGGANFDMVVVDEAQCLANYRTSISRMCWRFGQMDDVYRLGLSGTPTPNDPLQFFGVMRFINPRVFPNSYQEFEHHYAIVDQYHRVIEHRNTEEMQRLVFEQAYRVETKDVIKLPPQVFTTRYYDLSDEEARVYREMEKNMVTYLGKSREEELTAANILARTLRLSQIVSGLVEEGKTGRVLPVGDSRLNLLSEVIQNEIPSGEPFVVFARFKADLQRIKDVIEKLGFTCGEVSGRKSEWVDFKRGKFDAMVVQIRSGGAGIDLTRAAYVIYYAKDYGYGNYEQTLARVHRPGQTRTTTYVSLIANNTIDVNIERALARKGNLISEFMRQRRVDIDAAKVIEDTKVDDSDLEEVEQRFEEQGVA